MSEATTDWRGSRCGHNYQPEQCPHEMCGYRDALVELAELAALRAENAELRERLAASFERELNLKNSLEAAERAADGLYATWMGCSEDLRSDPEIAVALAAYQVTKERR